MRSGQSSRSPRQNSHHHHLQAEYHPPPPPGYTATNASPYPYYYHHHHHPHHIAPHMYQQSYYMPGQFVPPPPPPLPPPLAPPSYYNNMHREIFVVSSSPPPPPVPVPEYRQASTVKNDVNLNKATLQLESDEAVESLHVLTFSFDATAYGSISMHLLAREAADGSLSCISNIFPKAKRSYFKNGLGQKFREVIDFSLIDNEDLSRVGPDESYPLIIRIETSPNNPPPEYNYEEAAGGPVRKWINCQQTYAVIIKKDDGGFEVKVVKQIIWVDGVRYELQEIYGIANGNEEESSGNGDESDKDCAICLSEPKDTTVLPCRHMCMCSGCANVLKYKTNLCPLCRCPIEELLQIKVPETQLNMYYK